MSGTGQGGLGGNLPAAVRMAAIGLLIHQLMKSRDPGAAPADPQGGGLGDILGGLLGGGAGRAAPGTQADVGGLLGGLLGGGAGGGLGGLLGGLAGMLGGLRQQGLDEEVDSWISTGPNRPATPDRLAPAFDPDEVAAAARRAGTDQGTMMDALSRMLPEVVDRMTPQGRIPRPEVQGDAGAFDSLLGSLGIGAPRR